MKTIRLIAFLLFTNFSLFVSGQFLSHLKALKTDALFTTYAAPPARSHYKNDQGYQFQWYDGESGVEFISKEGPNLGIAFQSGKRLIFKLDELYREPVVTTSYSDLVKYYYYPFRDLRVEVFFDVYSSETAIVQFRIVNEGHFPVTISALPYLYYPSSDSIIDVVHQKEPNSYSFHLIKKRDSWMIEHHIPVCDTLTGWYTLTGLDTSPGICFAKTTLEETRKTDNDLYAVLLRAIVRQKRASPYIKGIISNSSFTLQPGDATSFRLAIGLAEGESRLPARGQVGGEALHGSEYTLMKDPDPDQLIKEDEQSYANIPRLSFKNKDQEMLYWSAFSLMRQCMMPAEGSCRQNYYVFSREPRWGWGYGGQVFHESLAMMAYAYMDPAGAMNSQRVFMDRQRRDGYINYRTGPYLDEMIETNDQCTSSAPWFNYENLQIYKITGDRQFLKEAYSSGSKFYQYYLANRDSGKNGLCEWGGHAELESVRDAREAVWDKVGWAANFEGPDVNSMLVMEAKALAEMAQLLGFFKESQQFHQDATRRTALINKTLWDSVTRFYYNVNKIDRTFNYKSPADLKIKEIIGFLPLWAGVADKEKAGWLVEKMKDTAEFWRPYGVPSLSAKSDYYCPIGYWNGPVWVQWEYLLYSGLRDYGYEKDAALLSDKVLENMIYHLKNYHVFWEFYSADDLEAGWNKTYIWAGIAVRFMIDADKQSQQIRP